MNGRSLLIVYKHLIELNRKETIWGISSMQINGLCLIFLNVLSCWSLPILSTTLPCTFSSMNYTYSFPVIYWYERNAFRFISVCVSIKFIVYTPKNLNASIVHINMLSLYLCEMSCIVIVYIQYISYGCGEIWNDLTFIRKNNVKCLPLVIFVHSFYLFLASALEGKHQYK